MSSSVPIVDIHTHVYPPSYIELLKTRDEIPYIRQFPPATEHRLVILPAEDTPSTSRGRPIGSEYYDISERIAFMDTHSIRTSIISLANPWLDWLPPTTALETALSINTEINSLCALHPTRLYFFGTLPLSASPSSILESIAHLKTLPYCRGIILGTSGLGSGLDDPSLLPIFKELAANNFPIFLHPHYGLPTSVFGPRGNDYGHVLPLALGFPMETTIAVTRMILSSVFSSVPDLQVILAHSGKLAEGRKTIWEILKKNIWLDAVVYGDVGVRGAVGVSGADRVMFGTDAPFFPPLDEEEEGKGEDAKQWLSVSMNKDAIRSACGAGSEEEKAILGGNAIRLFGLDLDASA
ncbi:amidohydrolase [Botrytis cinerea]